MAVTILSAGVLGLMTTIRLGSQTASQATNANGAVILAKELLEAATCIPRSNLEAGEGSRGRYNYMISYEEKPHNLMAATIMVNWLERGQTETMRLSQVFLPR